MKISNVEVKDLVNTYGSPLYVYNQRMIEDKLNVVLRQEKGLIK